jgi:hypothetical protein
MKMNIKNLVAAVALVAAAGSVFAQEYVVPDEGFVSTRTRAEVIAEIKQARADGTLEFNEGNYPVAQAAESVKTREQVRAELVEYRRQHPAELDLQYLGG